MQTDTVILEICLEVFQKLKIELPFDSAIPLSILGVFFDTPKESVTVL